MGVMDSIQAEAPARVLALILSADGSVNERAMSRLDALGGLELLGVCRDRFLALARDGSGQLAAGLCERSWLTDTDLAQTNALLDAVGPASERIQVCRLAAAVIEEEGLVTHGARLVFEHALAHWHINPAALAPFEG